MGRPALKSDVDDLERAIRKQNAVCSANLLQALRLNHAGVEAPEPSVEVTPIIPNPPCWNQMWFHDLIFSTPEIPPARVRIEDIQRAVAREYKVSRFDMLSARRTQDVVRPRQVGYYLAKKLTDRSLPEIARRFGGRDHSTAISGIRKIEKLVLTDEELAARIDKIKEALA